MDVANHFSTPELILINADVITLDPLSPRAKLVEIRGGKIASVGHDLKLDTSRCVNSQVIDCHGMTIMPGFIDTHIHLSSFAESFLTESLGPHNNIRSVSDIQTKIRQLSQEQPCGTWIRCGGYNEFYLAEKRHPNRWDLDSAISTHPVKLSHQTGHAHVLNSLGLKVTGISKDTPDPDGGIIDRDTRTGEPTGLLYGMGSYLSKVVPPLDTHELDKGMELANGELLSLGITSVQDTSSRNNIDRWSRFRRWKAQRSLKPRVSMALSLEGFEGYHGREFSAEVIENCLRIDGVKIILDETIGRLTPPQDELNDLVLTIHRSGLQALIHAIEETAIESACTAVEYALRKLPKPDHRHRIEHCAVCPPALSRRLSFLGIMVVTQPSFIYYSGDRYLGTVPEMQLKHLYPLATLMENGVQVAGSSDCPVTPPNPLMGIYSAVSRMSESGKSVGPNERITPCDAVRLYTEYAARATFEERIKGSITPGKLADLTVLSGDPTKLPTEEIRRIQVEMTLIDGKVVWDKAGLANDTSFDI
jgi:predicted amidohydrolase YtcJ